MASSWEHFGEIANVAQLTGLDAVKLIGMIVKAANTARMHKKNCRQFAQHLKLIGNLLDQLKISELKKYPETREPLEQLEDALRRKAQNEIDRYLRLVPLITLVDNTRVNTRVMERLEVIEKDQCEYTLDDEDQKVQTVFLKPEPNKEDTVVLKKTLSCTYPNFSFTEALKKENEKLQLELQHSQANMDINQCEFIQRLLDVTEVAAYSLPEKLSPENSHKKVEYISQSYSDANGSKGHSSDEKHRKSSDTLPASRSSVSEKDLRSTRSSYQQEDWHTDLLACCSEPYLCIRTFFYPCGTFSKIATVATNRPICPEKTSTSPPTPQYMESS
ncbi:cornifelin [Trifolium pratense]|uniref:Cornifelin n=1 Tax=Trifolium pratense TaxID=57577 RepID=A0A2K3NTP8_TRIPR|nr:cornifelin [Trifolium pratense]